MHDHAVYQAASVRLLDARVLSAAGAGRPDLLENALAAGGCCNARDYCGDTPLLLAARGGTPSHLEVCRQLLAAGADAGCQGSRGETAAMVAVEAGNEGLLEMVLVPGACLEARSDDGITVLQLACLRLRPAMLACLLRHMGAQHGVHSAAPAGQTPATSSSCSGIMDGTACHMDTSDRQAAAPGTPERQQAAQRAAGRHMVLAMFAAVAAGEPRCLQHLVSEPLARAAYTADFRPHGHGSGSGGGSSMDETALLGGRLERWWAQWGRDHAAEERLQGELSFLLDADTVGPHNARLASFLWQTNGMPCHLAAALGQPECLHILLSSAFCRTDECTSDGFTPLMLAATTDAPAVVAVLLAAEAALEARNAAGRTPTFLAAISGSADALRLLVKAGADVNAAEPIRECTPLAAAAARLASLGSAASAGPGDSSAPKADAFLRCIALLLKAGADPRRRCKDGSTALHAAAEGGALPCLELLLDHSVHGMHGGGGSAAPQDGSDEGISPDLPLLEAEDCAGRTALARLAGAARTGPGHRDCILFLLSRGAAVRSADMLLGKLLSAGDAGGVIITVWQLLACLTTAQLRGLTACPGFYDLPHSEATERALPAAAVGAMLDLAAEGASNLLYNVSAADSAHHGRRPAYLFELLRRAAVGACACRPSCGCGGAEHGAACGAAQAGAVAMREAVAGSTHVAKLLQMWTSGQMLLQHACCLVRCRGVPQSDREHLSVRVGHLLSAYHSLGGLCSVLGLSLTAGVHRPYAPLGETSAAALGAWPAAALQRPGTPQPVAALQSLSAEEHGSETAPMEAEDDGGSCRSAELSVLPGALQQVPAADPDDDAKDAQPGVDAPSNTASGATAEALTASPANACAAPAGAPAPAATRSPVSTLASVQLQQPQRERAVEAALLAFGEAAEELAGCAGDAEQLRAWHFLLEYPQAASLACRQRLLHSLIAAWPRRRDAQLLLTTGRAGVTQRVCIEVEERRTAAGGTVCMGASLWHGIKVAFEEENGTGDGVQREWFRLLAAELTHPDTGLFESHDGGASYLPALHASIQSDGGDGGGHLPKFELIGCMIGLGLMQGCTLPGLALSAATWRLVLGQPPRPLHDLAASDPLLHRNLCLLRDMGPDVSTLGLHFELQDALGRAVELSPGGSHKLVTAGNLERYIASVARYKAVDSQAAKAAALARGLCGVLTGGVLDTLGRCFGHAELNAMVAGIAELDVPAWQTHTRYDQCTPSTPQVAWLWAALAAGGASARACLLAFVTGASTLPAGGFAALRGFNGAPHPFTVCLVPSEGDERLPRASTCFNTLFLPAYSCQAVLAARLAQATHGEQAFDEAVIRR